jgi:hypothetical protein
MTLNHFKSFFIIEEMKCKIWDSTFVKYLNVTFDLKPIVSSITINLCIFTIVVFSPNVQFKDSKHIIVNYKMHIS